MTRRDDTPSCTAVAGCTGTVEYELRGSGGIIGTRRTAPKPVHLFSCRQHLRYARREIANREQRSITTIEAPQQSLFDTFDHTEGQH